LNIGGWWVRWTKRGTKAENFEDKTEVNPFVDPRSAYYVPTQRANDSITTKDGVWDIFEGNNGNFSDSTRMYLKATHNIIPYNSKIIENNNEQVPKIGKQSILGRWEMFLPN